MPYLDNQVIAPLSPRAVAEMLPFFSEKWGSPQMPHAKAEEVLPAVEEALDVLYALVQAKDEDHFVFTSSGAEAVNHLLYALYFDLTRNQGKNHFITSCVDEAPTIMAMSRLQELGCTFEMLPVDQWGRVTLEALSRALKPSTAIVSLSWASGMTGILQPIEAIAELCQERGVLLHVDATHVLGRGHFPWVGDFLTFNGEPLHAPKGSGGLFIRQGLEVAPFILGGHEQAHMRGGSFNIPALIGLKVAVQELMEKQNYMSIDVALLRDLLEKQVCDKVSKAHIFFQEEERLPHLSAMGFEGVTNDALLYFLNKRGVFAHFGGGHYQKISHVLAASNIEKTLTHTALSFSLSRLTTKEDILQTVEAIEESVCFLRKLSAGIYE